MLAVYIDKQFPVIVRVKSFVIVIMVEWQIERKSTARYDTPLCLELPTGKQILIRCVCELLCNFNLVKLVYSMLCVLANYFISVEKNTTTSKLKSFVFFFLSFSCLSKAWFLEFNSILMLKDPFEYKVFVLDLD